MEIIIKKHKKTFENLKEKENVLLDKMNHLFDVSNQNKLVNVKIEVDTYMKFLNSQRLIEYAGSMLRVDRKLIDDEKRRLSCEEKVKKYT